MWLVKVTSAVDTVPDHTPTMQSSRRSLFALSQRVGAAMKLGTEEVFVNSRRATTAAVPSACFASRATYAASPISPVAASALLRNCVPAVNVAGARAYSSIVYPPSEAFVGKPAPKFRAMAVVDSEFKEISLDDYKGKYVVLFFYPKDFTYVCPSEIISFSDRAKEFEELGAQLIAASTDTEEVHLAWIKTPRRKGGLGHMQIPILADTTKEIAAKYGCLVPQAGIALRGLYIINPQGVLEQIIVNNMPIGRSVDEAKRLLQAIQFVAEHGEVCPANWTPGAKTMTADPDKSMEYFSTMAEETGDDEMAASIPAVTSAQHFEELISSNDKVLFDFYAPWCGKCRMIAPTVEHIAQSHPGLKVFKVDTDTDALAGLKTQLGVKALPTFRFYKGGKEVLDEVVGYKKRPLEEAAAKLEGM